MDALLFVLLVASTTAVCLAGGKEDCPPWFEWVNSSDSSGYCVCATDAVRGIDCNQRKQTSSLSKGYCVFYSYEENLTEASRCPFLFPDKEIMNGLFPLPANVSELNSVVCGNLSREVKGPVCGRCTNGTGPSIYSVGSRCVHCSPVNIIYYLLLQYLPSTVMFLLVIIFRPNITSAPMANYVLFCNAVVLYSRVTLWLYTKLDSTEGKLALTLSAVWSFDTFLFFSPPMCVSKYMEEIYMPFLEFLATIYPFILLLLTYGVIKLHAQHFKPVVFLWRLFGRVFIQCYRAWDPRSSMIQAFASLFFLSYAKLSYLIWETFLWGEDINSDGKVKRYVLYIDPNVTYFSTKHILLMAFSVGVAVFVFLPPLLILAVYPTSLYRKISHRIQPKWRFIIKTYVETFHGSFKDGTNGTRDYRSLSALFLLLIIFAPQLLIATITSIKPNDDTIATYATATFISLVAFLCTLLQPYKHTAANALTTGLLLSIGLMFTLAEGIYDDWEREALKVLMIILLLIPHFVFWGYVVWKVAKLLDHRCSNRDDGERERLLHGTTESERNGKEQMAWRDSALV